MGSSASKQAARKFPIKQAANQATQLPKQQQQQQQPPQEHAKLQRPAVGDQDTSAQHKSESIQRDGHDPDFLDRLKQMGTVKYHEIPKHEYSKENEILGTLKAREKSQQEAQLQYEQRFDSSQKKHKVHPGTISTILQSSKHGDSPQRIIEDFNLTNDFLQRLGPRYSIPEQIPEDSIAAKEIRSMHQPKHPNKKPKEGEIRPPKEFKEKSIDI